MQAKPMSNQESIMKKIKNLKLGFMRLGTIWRQNRDNDRLDDELQFGAPLYNSPLYPLLINP